MSDDDSSRPADERERAAAEALRAAVDESMRRPSAAGGGDATSELLLAAMSPRALDASVHEQILARALGLEPAALGDGSVVTSDDAARAGDGSVVTSDDAARAGDGSVVTSDEDATPSERRGAAVLRSALEGAAETHPLAELAHAVRAAHDPRPIVEIRNEALLAPALRHAGGRRRAGLFAAVASLAVAAAAIGLYLRSAPPAPDSTATLAPAPAEVMLPGMAPLRSTQELFSPEDFPREGGTTERSDRISQARQHDLRENRFARWGVQ